jgi:CheY-like chemotaxis protein
MSKIESGHITIMDNPMSILDVIETSVGIFHNAALEKKLNLFSYVDCNIPAELLGDKNRINQILMNLITNAIKYSNIGHIKVSAYLISENNDTATIQIQCKDTGIGIADDDKSHLFKPFIQLNQNTSSIGSDELYKDYKGYGLGLSIIDKLVTLMKGEVWVKSELGEGSTFIVQLTLKKTANERSINDNLSQSVFNNLLVILCNNKITKVVTLYAKQMHVENIVAPNDNMDDELVDFVTKTKRTSETAAIIVDDVLYNLLDIEHVPCKIIVFQSPLKQMQKAIENNVTVIKEPVSLQQLATVLSGRCKTSDLLATHKERVRQLKDEFQKTNIRVLIVEDSPINRKVLERLLNNIGVRDVDTANNGLDGIQKVENSEPYSIIIMDILMPECDGCTATRRIRLLPDKRKASIPIIALTANAWQKSIKECLEAGCNDVLTKPVSLESLMRRLKQFLQNSNNLRE